jgi:hypothetical protein
MTVTRNVREVTRYNMPPADDPSSLESFLRLRKNRLAVGPYRVLPEKRYDADRLRRDLASVREAGRDPRVLAARLADGADEREELRRRYGWTDERIDGARDELQRHVHPPRTNVTAGAGVSATRSRPSSLPPIERLGTAGQHITAARAAGYDPVKLWPSLRGLVASGGPNRPFSVAGPRSGASSGLPGWSNPSGAIRDADGGRRGRRSWSG